MAKVYGRLCRAEECLLRAGALLSTVLRRIGSGLVVVPSKYEVKPFVFGIIYTTRIFRCQKLELYFTK